MQPEQIPNPVAFSVLIVSATQRRAATSFFHLLCSCPQLFKAQCFFSQQMDSLLKHKILQLVLKISLYMAPTCFGPFGPSSGSIHQNLAKGTVFVELLVKIHC
jgi:hypothetical protein